MHNMLRKLKKRQIHNPLPLFREQGKGEMDVDTLLLGISLPELGRHVPATGHPPSSAQQAIQINLISIILAICCHPKQCSNMCIN